MKRKLFNLAAIFSMLLLLVISVFWVRSYFIYDSFSAIWTKNVVWSADQKYKRDVISFFDGEVIVGQSMSPISLKRSMGDSGWTWSTRDPTSGRMSPMRFPIEYASENEMLRNGWYIRIADWVNFLLTAILPVVWIQKRYLKLRLIDLKKLYSNPMKRHWLGLIALVSIIVCVGMSVLWVRSYWRSDRVYHDWYGKQARYGTDIIESDGGRIIFTFVQGQYTGQSYDMSSLTRGYAFSTYTRAYRTTHLDRTPATHFLGFAYLADDRRVGKGSTGSLKIMALPHWFVILVTGIVFRIAIVKRRELKKRDAIERGLCEVCGYDLRGTPERCPECGTAVEKDHAASTTSLGPTGGDTSPG